MSRIRQLIEVLRRRSDVGVVEHERSWLVAITKGRDLYCEVTIPHDALEWFACVKHRREKRDVWSDWMDYSGYGDTPKEKLEAEMAEDVLAFVERVSGAELVLPLRIYEDRS